MSSDRKIFYLKPFSSRDIEYGTVFNYRGVYSLGPEIFTVNSLIGILKLRKHIPLNKPVRVYPRELEVKDFNVMISLNEDGDGPIKTETTNTEPYQFKEYQETDDIRHVHWKLSSRSENLIVKEYSVRYSINLMLYLTPFSKDSGINRIQKEDMLIESFISVCKFLLDSGIEYEVVYAEGENVVKKAILNSRDYMEFYNITPSLVFNETFAQEMQNKYNQCIDACNKDIYFFTSDLDDDTLYYINSVKLLENEIICFHCNQNGINIEAYDKFKCADIPYTMIKYENDSLICISDLSYLQQSYGG
ncbi:MAG: DUF58 domain-containing protein [Clostridiales bacterium]|nr:DUF58 domain-containing protein [Clostridiales bacterium]